MPIYDLKCPNCDARLTSYYCRCYSETVRCACGATMVRQPVKTNPHCFPQDGLFLEHVEPRGKRFMSKKEMQDYEKKTGTWIDCLH